QVTIKLSRANNRSESHATTARNIDGQENGVRGTLCCSGRRMSAPSDENASNRSTGIKGSKNHESVSRRRAKSVSIDARTTRGPGQRSVAHRLQRNVRRRLFVSHALCPNVSPIFDQC